MSGFENRTPWNRELPKSTQSFENMLDEVGQTPDDAARTVSTTFSDSELFYLTGNNNYGEIEAVGENDQAGDKRSNRNSSSTDSICTQCKFAKRLNSIIDYIGAAEIGDKSISEVDGLSLFVDQIEEPGDQERKNLPKRSFSDTAVDRTSDSRFISKRFKSEGFCSATKIPNFATGFKSTKISARNCDGRAFDEDEDPSEPAERDDNNCSELRHDDVQTKPLTASADPDKPSSEILTGIESAERGLGVLDQIKISSQTLNRPEVDDSTFAQSKIEDRRVEEHSDDDDSNNAARILDQTLSPNPFDDHDNDLENAELVDAIETRSLSSFDSTFSQSTIEEIYCIDVTEHIDCSNSVETVERPLQEEILEKTAINLNTAQQIDKELDNAEVRREDINPEKLTPPKSGTVVNDNAEDVKNIQTETEIVKENLNLVDKIGDREPDLDSGKNRETSRLLDESFLDVSIESEKIYDEMNSSVYLSSRERHEETTRRASADLTTIDKKGDNGAGNSKQLKIRDDSGARLPTDGESEDNEKRDEVVTEVMNPVHPVLDPPESSASITEPKTSGKDVDNSSLDLLSESELERIEKEAYAKSEKTYNAENLNNVNPDERDMFYRPQKFVTDTRNNDLVLPNWVRNPAPEPDYEKMRRCNQSRSEYIKKLLQEILRLSKIISKVAKALREEPQIGDSDMVAERIPQIQDPRPAQNAENNPNIRSYNSRASANTETTVNRSTENAALKGSHVFYVPQSSSNPKHVMIPRPVKLEASINVIEPNCRSEIEETEKFFVPQSGGSKYDATFVFNRQMDKLNASKASCSYGNTEASSFYNPSDTFGSQKGGSSGNKACELSSNSVAQSDRKLSGETQLPKRSFQDTTISDSRASNIGSRQMNNPKTVTKDTIFYSPDNFSSASTGYTRLPSVSQSQMFFSKNSVTVEPFSLNYGKNLTARTNLDNNDSVFYSGNK